MQTLAAALLAALAAAQPRAEVTVSAAVSLTEAVRQIAAMYEARSGERIVLNFGASNALARQIAAGARVDLFISADEAQLRVVADYLQPGSRVDVVANELAVAVPDDRARGLRSVADLTGDAFRRIAIGDPAAVPAGVYAKAYLERLGLWRAIAPKVVPAGSVRLALAAVESGAADAAIVYRTDIPTARRAREAYVVAAAEGPRIVYPAALIRGSPNPAGAARFLSFLRSPEARGVFARAGFLPP